MQIGDTWHGGSERDGDVESDRGSSMTDYPSEDDEVLQLLSQPLAPSDGSNDAAQGGSTLRSLSIHVWHAWRKSRPHDAGLS